MRDALFGKDYLTIGIALLILSVVGLVLLMPKEKEMVSYGFAFDNMTCDEFRILADEQIDGDKEVVCFTLLGQNDTFTINATVMVYG